MMMCNDMWCCRHSRAANVGGVTCCSTVWCLMMCVMMQWQTGFAFICLFIWPIMSFMFPSLKCLALQNFLCVQLWDLLYAWALRCSGLCPRYSSSASVCAMNSSRLWAVQELSQPNATSAFSSVFDRRTVQCPCLIPWNAHQRCGGCAVTVASYCGCPDVSGVPLSEPTVSEVCANFIKWSTGWYQYTCWFCKMILPLCWRSWEIAVIEIKNTVTRKLFEFGLNV